MKTPRYSFLLALSLVLLPVLASAEKAAGTGPATSETTAATSPPPKLGKFFSGTSGSALREEEKVTLEFKDTSVMEALKKLAKAAGISFAVKGEIPQDLKVTVYLQDASPSTAMNLLCNSAGLVCEFTPGGWVISVPPTIDISGVMMPVVRAMNIGSTDFSDSTPGASLVLKPNTVNPPFDGDGALIDLEVKDVPLEEAVRQLFAGTEAVIKFHPSVPKDLKVTASVRSYYRREALISLLRQANLTYDIREPSLGKGKKRTEVTIIPKTSFSAQITAGSLPVKNGGESGEGIIARANQLRAALAAAQTNNPTPSPASFKDDDKPTSVDFRDVPIAQAIALLFRDTELSYIFSPTVSEKLKVTARLEKVPLGMALNIILARANLSYIVFQPLSMIIISPNPRAAQSVTSVSTSGKVVTSDLPKCPKCGAPMQPGWKYCPWDNTRLKQK
jgi:type II secretory pathway component GspD/PulD (secretin)